jgi:HD-like signal output (HDOD) protein
MGFASEAVADLPDSTRIALTGMRSLPGLTSHPRSFASTRRPVCDSAFFAAAERDPALAAQILRLCCSHYFGARRTVPDVHAAVALLGPSAVEAVIAGLDALGSEDALWAPARRTAAHATRTAVLARDIALDMGCAIPVADHAYSAALLHEVGQLVQSRDLGDRVTPLILAPRQTPSTSAREGAPVLAGRLLTLWGLPATIVSAIADHKRPSSAADPAASGVLAAVHVADAIQHALESGTAPAIDCDYLGRLGLTNKLGGWIDAASDASRTA